MVSINDNLPAAGASETFTPQVKATGGAWTPKTGGNITLTRESSSGDPFNPNPGGGDFSST